MTSNQPQSVVTPITHSAIFLTLTVEAGGEPVVRELLPDLAGLRRAVGFRVPHGNLVCVTGIGSAAWDLLFPDGPRPAGLHPFQELRGTPHTAPATPGDLFFHLRAERMDLCFELAHRITDRLAGAAAVVDEVHGFKYFDERDLLGFVDGTENPSGPDAEAAALIGDEDPVFAGGSYVIVQKYLHDLTAWDRLPVEQQERIVGRTKLEDIELPDDVKPSNSHVALNTLTEPDGTQRQILRDNMPFGAVGEGEFGTYFIGYAATPDVTEEMLRHMFLGEPPNDYDRILDFSTAVTGCLFAVPPAGFLEDPPVPGEAAAAEAVESPPAEDGSLGVGSLRG